MKYCKIFAFLGAFGTEVRGWVLKRSVGALEMFEIKVEELD